MSRMQKNWELWSKGDEWSGGDLFINAYKDKGEAMSRMRRLKRHHPGVYYFLKHRRSGTTTAWSTRAWRRRNTKMADRWRDRRRTRKTAKRRSRRR